MGADDWYGDVRIKDHEVKVVPKARDWIPDGQFAVRCPYCGQAVNARLAASWHYCPFCGGQMRAEH